MGTNYYLLTGKTETVECDLGCKHELPEKLHIGKSSYGNYFTLHGMTAPDGTKLYDFRSWKKYFESLPEASIINEYGDKIEPEEMWNCITRTDWPCPAAKDTGWKPSLVGKKVNRHGMSDGATWGEKGFIYYGEGVRAIGKDGLYTVLEAEFS